MGEGDRLGVPGLQLVPEGDHRALLGIGGAVLGATGDLDADDQAVRARRGPPGTERCLRVRRAVVAVTVVAPADRPRVERPADAVLRKAADHLAVPPSVGRLLERVVDRHAPERVPGEVLGDALPLRHVPHHGERRPPAAGAVVLGGGVGDPLPPVAAHGRSLGRSTDSRPATVSSSGTSTVADRS